MRGNKTSYGQTPNGCSSSVVGNREVNSPCVLVHYFIRSPLESGGKEFSFHFRTGRGSRVSSQSPKTRKATNRRGSTTRRRRGAGILAVPDILSHPTWRGQLSDILNLRSIFRGHGRRLPSSRVPVTARVAASIFSLRLFALRVCRRSR